MIKAKEIFHRGARRIQLDFKYDIKLISLVKKIYNARWSKTRNAWHVPYSDRSVAALREMFPNINLDCYKGKVKSTVPIKVTNIKHVSIRYNRQQNLLYIDTPFELKDKIKKLEQARWHVAGKLWIASANSENFNQIEDDIKGLNTKVTITESNFSLFDLKKENYKSLGKLTASHKNELSGFKIWMVQRRYSTNTIEVYLSCVTIFFRYYFNRSIEGISVKDIENFNSNFIINNRYSAKTQNQYISAIKLFYVKMKGIHYEINSIERPIKWKQLPKVLPIEQVQAMLTSIPNIKHKVALSTIYGLGLRRSELINLKLEDISFGRNVVMIINTKGNKDRDLPLPAKLKDIFSIYLKQVRPKKWLIEGQKRGEQYSTSSLSNIFHKYCNKIIPNNSFSLHSLRHSYATHLLDMGVDLRIIQKLLGHKSSRTTEIYTHVSMHNLKNIKNPLNDFDI